MTRAVLLLAVLLTACASPHATMPPAVARPHLQLGPWPYRVGPITVLVFQRAEDVRAVCATPTGRSDAGGCYFVHAGKEYIVTTPEWDVVLHELKHVFEGAWHR